MKLYSILEDGTNMGGEDVAEIIVREQLFTTVDAAHEFVVVQMGHLLDNFDGEGDKITTKVAEQAETFECAETRTYQVNYEGEMIGRWVITEHEV